MFLFFVMCVGIGAVSGILLKARHGGNAASQAVGKAAVAILVAFWTISLLTLPLGQGVAAVLLSVLGVLAARGVLGRDTPDGKPVPVVLDGASDFRDLVPTPHLFVEGVDGSGLTTYLARIADAARKEGRPVMVVVRSSGDQDLFFADIPADDDFVIEICPRFNNLHADFGPWHAEMIEKAKAFAQRPDAVILFDKMPADASQDLDTLTAWQGMVTAGACVVVCGFRFPTLITPQTSLLAFKGWDCDQPIFPGAERMLLQPGEGVLRVPGRADARVKIAAMDA